MLYAWFASFLLHNLSKVSSFYPLIVAGLATTTLLTNVKVRHRRSDVVVVLATVWVTAYVLAVDVFREGAWPQTTNLVRLLTPLAAMAIILVSEINERALRKLSLVFALVVWVAALSLFYQVINGPVTWFADASERAGVQRYASLLGSLTVFGTAAPIALLCVAMYVRGASGMLFWALPLLAAGVMSLQKAALAGFLVLMPFLFALMGRKGALRLGAVVLVVAFGLISTVPPAVVDYFEVGWLYFLEGGGGSTDVGIASSAVARLVEYPVELIAHHGLGSMILGVGLRGGSGVFGFVDDPMAHNGVVDYLAIGGIPYLVYGVGIIAFMCASAAKVVRYRAQIPDGDRVSVFIVGLTTLYLANLPFASGIGFHPAFCWIPPLIISFGSSAAGGRAGLGPPRESNSVS